MQTEMSVRRTSVWMIGLAALLYALLLALVEHAHTFWRDEAEAWIVARDSHGWLSLLHNIRYEGHPPAWYAILYGLTRFTTNVDWMKLPNFIFAVATALMILTAQRVVWPVRLGLTFSYFFLFEYAVIDRNYMLGIACLIGALTWMRHPRGPFGVPVLLSLAALSSLPALVVAVCLYPLHLLPDLRSGPGQGLAARLRGLSAASIAGMLLFAVSVLGALAEIRPPADSGLMLDSLPAVNLRHTIARNFHSVAKAYLPLPPFHVAFWNNFAGDTWSLALFAVVGLLLALALCFFFRTGTSRAFFLGTSGLLLAQMTVSRRVEARHVGWLFVVFALTLLFEQVAWLRQPEGQTAGWRGVLLYTILSVQVAGGLFAMLISMRHTFSGSRDVARFLQSQGYGTQPMVFAPDYVSLPVLAYLQRPSAYYLEDQRQGSIIAWTKKEFYGRHLPSREEIEAAAQDGVTPVLITEHPLSPDKMAELKVHPLTAIRGETNPDTYFIYR